MANMFDAFRFGTGWLDARKRRLERRPKLDCSRCKAYLQAKGKKRLFKQARKFGWELSPDVLCPACLIEGITKPAPTWGNLMDSVFEDIKKKAGDN